MKTTLDLETIPQQPEAETKAEIAKTIQAPATMKKAETIADWHEGKGKYAGVKDIAIEEAYRKTSFDGGKGEIVSISFAVDDGGIFGLDRDYREPGSEAKLITSFIIALGHELSKRSNDGRPPFFIGHYLAGFDLKFLWHRCVINGINPAFNLPFNGKHGKDFYDNMIAWAGYKGTVSQDSLCKALGIEGKPGDIDGSNVWDHIKAGDREKVRLYNMDDVDKCRQIYNRINFIGE